MLQVDLALATGTDKLSTMGNLPCFIFKGCMDFLSHGLAPLAQSPGDIYQEGTTKVGTTQMGDAVVAALSE